jgi:hypothetical protein
MDYEKFLMKERIQWDTSREHERVCIQGGIRNKSRKTDKVGTDSYEWERKGNTERWNRSLWKI